MIYPIIRDAAPSSGGRCPACVAQQQPLPMAGVVDAAGTERTRAFSIDSLVGATGTSSSQVAPSPAVKSQKRPLAVAPSTNYPHMSSYFNSRLHSAALLQLQFGPGGQSQQIAGSLPVGWPQHPPSANLAHRYIWSRFQNLIIAKLQLLTVTVRYSCQIFCKISVGTCTHWILWSDNIHSGEYIIV